MLTEIKLSLDYLLSMKKGDFGTNRKMKLHLFVTREKESFLIKTIFRDKTIIIVNVNQDHCYLEINWDHKE